MAAFKDLLLIVLWFHYCIYPTESDATLKVNVDDTCTITLASDGTTFTDIGTATTWATQYTFTIPEADISASTVIKFTCQDSSSPGGFISNINYNSIDFYTTDPITSSNYEFISSSDGSTTLVYTANGGGNLWGDSAKPGIPDAASWIWNNAAGNTVVFHFNFASIFTVDPTRNPTKYPTQPSSNPTLFPTLRTSDPSVSPTSQTREPTSVTGAPTSQTLTPSQSPTNEPTTEPTAEPTTEPTTDPTLDPTTEPTVEPTLMPIIASTDSSDSSDSNDSSELSQSEAMIQLLLDNWIYVAAGGGALVIIIIIIALKCRTGKVKLYKPNNQDDDDVILTVIQTKKSVASVSEARGASTSLFQRQKSAKVVLRTKDEEDNEQEEELEIDENLFAKSLNRVNSGGALTADSSGDRFTAGATANAAAKAQIAMTQKRAMNPGGGVTPGPPKRMNPPPQMSQAAPSPGGAVAAPIPGGVTAAPIPGGAAPAPIPASVPAPIPGGAVPASIPAAVPAAVPAAASMASKPMISEEPAVDPHANAPCEKPDCKVYEKMKKIKMPEASIRNKMRMDCVDEYWIRDFFGEAQPASFGKINVGGGGGKGGKKGTCTDCGAVKSGKTYEADGSFYCWACWKNYQ
eukprot:17766_1